MSVRDARQQCFAHPARGPAGASSWCWLLFHPQTPDGPWAQPPTPHANIQFLRLRKHLRIRKNSLFYKTEEGAEVGDLFMSLIHTCELNDVNPFDYLAELQKHAEELAKNPAAWVPWNYRQTLQQSGTSNEPA
jgi:hypothetical protein